MKSKLTALCFAILANSILFAAVQKPTPYSPDDKVTKQETCAKIIAQSTYGNAKYEFEYADNPQFNHSVRVKAYNNSGSLGFGFTLPLRFNTTYYWRSKIFVGTDSSDWSVSRSFTTDTAITILGPSDNLTKTSAGVYFSWSRNAHYDQYILECDTQSDFKSPSLCQQFLTDTFSWFYLETREKCIQYSSKYFWRLRGYKGSDSSQWTATRNFTTQDTVRIYNPGVLISSASTSTRIDFAWDRFVTHQVQYDTLADFSSPDNILNVSTDDYAYCALRNLKFDKTYYWRLRACATTDSTIWTKPRVLNVQGFSNKNAFQSGDNPIPPTSTFSFNLIDSAVSYRIQADTTPKFNSVFLIDSLRIYDPKKSYGQNRGIEFSEIPFKTQLYVRIRPQHAADTGAWSLVYSRPTIAKATNYYPYNTSVNVPVYTPFYIKSYTGIEKYRIQRDVKIDFSSPELLDTQFSAGSQFYLPTMKFNHKYYWRLCYINGSDTSYWSDPAGFTTQVAPILKYPLQLHLSSPGVKVSFDWDSMPGSTAYELMLDTSKNFDSPVLKTHLRIGDTSNMLIQHLYFGKYYWWKVRALTDIDTSLWSDAWFFTTPASPSLDWPYNNQTGISFSSLDWRSIPGTQGYEYMLDTDSLFTNPWTGKESKEQPFFHYFSPNPTTFNTKYFWKIRVFHEEDTSQWSEIWKFTTRERYGVKLLYPALGQEKIPPGHIMNWEAISDATTYVIAISEFPDMRNASFSTSATKQLIVSLKTKQKYYWQVIAKNKDGIHLTDTSLTFHFTTDSAFAAPNLLTPADQATKVALNNVTFSWSSVTGATYEIQFSLDPGFTTSQTSAVSGSGTVISNFIGNRVYYWRVRAKNAYSTGPWSGSRSFTTTFGLFTHTGSLDAFRVYPNPGNGTIYISGVEHGDAYSITDLFGRKVKEGIFNSPTETQMLDLHELRSGIYWISLESDGVFETKKIEIIGKE